MGAAEQVCRPRKEQTVTSRAGTSDQQAAKSPLQYSRLEFGSKPEPASVLHLSSGNVGWCAAGAADRNRCQLYCWRDSRVSCCYQLGHRGLEQTRRVGHQHHRLSCRVIRSGIIGDLNLAKSTLSWMDWAGVDLSSSMTRHTRCRATYEQSHQQHRSVPSIRIFVGHRQKRALWSPDAEWW